MTKPPSRRASSENTRTLRLIRIMQELRSNPRQSFDSILKTFNISRSQFYNDRDALAAIGFKFSYQTGSGFRILEDRMTPISDFSLSDRVTLLFALEHLSSCGDGLVAAKAIEVGRKLVGGLDSPFKEHLLSLFDREVTQKTYGIDPELYATLIQAVSEGRRVKILYTRSGEWTERWREVDPRRIYMRQRVLYLYARTVDEEPFAWKSFRLSRIREIRPTGICLTSDSLEDDGFQEQQKNAFGAFLGVSTQTVKIRFKGEAIPYVREGQWHESQRIEENDDGSITFSVSVAEPQEVIRWSRQFGENAEVISEDEDTSQALTQKE